MNDSLKDINQLQQDVISLLKELAKKKTRQQVLLESFSPSEV
jgi:hypothetical protein